MAEMFDTVSIFPIWFKIMKIIYCLQKLVFLTSDSFPTSEQ